MTAKIIDGKRVAGLISESLQSKMKELVSRSIVPGLTVVLVGDDPASRVYVSRKDKTARELGLNARTIELPDTVPQDELLGVIDELNNDLSVHGILVQLPLSGHIDSDLIVESIDPGKDVDGFHPRNVGALVLGKPGFVPCTPAGIMALLESENINPNGKNVVVLGRSNIVGKPVANLLLQKNPSANATVTICHTGTVDIKEFTSRADIVIAALGRANAVHGSILKQGAVVIDVGVNRVPDASRKSGYRLVGDVDFESASAIASAITPVPGGVGPMTIVMLMKNTIQAAESLAGTQAVGT